MKTLEFINLILGEQLSSVEFVQDYIQLHFDGPTLTLFAWPVVITNEKEHRFGTATDYRDELCRRIGHKVLDVVTNNNLDSFRIRFDDGTDFAVSLRPEDRSGPEAGYFTASRDPREPLRDF
jgi:hypothetical protein